MNAAPEIAEKFATYPEPIRERLLMLRALILEVATEDPRIGDLQESLKWGQPAYRPTRARIGTTLRMDSAGLDGYALYYHCQSKLGEQYDALYGNQLKLDHRSITIPVADPPATDVLRDCIQMALTYHLQRAGAVTN